jgi:hypothetical protein
MIQFSKVKYNFIAPPQPPPFSLFSFIIYAIHSFIMKGKNLTPAQGPEWRIFQSTAGGSGERE